MKKLYKQLPSFAPDYSGVLSVFFEMDCLKIIHGQGGCTGNYCYVDELRWGNKRKNVFCSGISETEAILGDDTIIVNKVLQAQKDLECGFIVICNSPIPTILGTDIKAISRLIEKKSSSKVLDFDTHGLKYYDEGQRLAYLKIVDELIDSSSNDSSIEVNLIGATPLDGWDEYIVDDLKKVFMNQGFSKVSCWGMSEDLFDIKLASRSKLNVALSVSALPAVKKLKEEWGIPFIVGFPIGKMALEKYNRQIQNNQESVINEKNSKKRVLIISEQFNGNSIRNCLRDDFGFIDVDVVSFFGMEAEYMEDNDKRIKYEDDLNKLLREREVYDIVIGDGFLKRLCNESSLFIQIAHPAISGHNNTPHITEFSYEPHLAMVCGEYNTPKIINMIGEKGYEFLEKSIEKKI